ncbi:hypothetical protein B5F14_09760, partial [Faecalitalea cylindroides]
MKVQKTFISIALTLGFMSVMIFTMDTIHAEENESVLFNEPEKVGEVTIEEDNQIENDNLEIGIEEDSKTNDSIEENQDTDLTPIEPIPEEPEKLQEPEKSDDEQVIESPENPLLKDGWNGDQYIVNGKPVIGKYQIDGIWYYFDEGGHKVVNDWYVDENGDKEYYGMEGHQCLGKTAINGTYYYFDLGTGKMKMGLIDKCFYSNDGTIYYGQKKVNEFWYYFDPLNEGVAATGITYIPEEYNPNGGAKTVYYNNLGRLEVGQKRIGDY